MATTLPIPAETASEVNNGNNAEAEMFRQHLLSIASWGQLSMALALGSELGLFKALANSGTAKEPATAEAVAHAIAGNEMKPRYIQEWLSCMACAGIIECDENGEKFWIAEERVSILVGKEVKDDSNNTVRVLHPDSSLLINGILPTFGGNIFHRVAEVFRADGPLGFDYTANESFFQRIDEFSHSIYNNRLRGNFFNLLGVGKELSEGIAVLDVGCGVGFYVMEMAKQFPKCHITGVDFSESCIRKAKEDAKLFQLTNVDFIQSDAAKLPTEWSNRYDLIMLIYSCHHQCRPDRALQEIHRCLKPGGLFAMIETGGMGNCHADRVRYGAELSTLYYAQSVFHCLPAGSNQPDALQLGAMWGVGRGKQLLEEAGFTSDCISVEPFQFEPTAVLYKATKAKVVAKEKMN